ncbi:MULTISPECIES: DUF305 domain-containing protein [Devosia]|jgi:uncharacterized protein (DUF305 family)|uniref:DUF305 domain-containing protein n=1 Tax=Devosia litorisediminis TaxID=2829817 RepID=A0A942EDD0_9HYPH|nr:MULTISPECIES: DUF305 domain-containing protein [Devosia]MBS3849214.1 DUF305 domain-containing protein [Devosia litorisediminis]MCZ4344782.1 DUF305 domain-containing protein [Devosia neptuniae]|tara:strand:- start:34 stop:387 length:354 start_codon:yes stop_codon:yes gene_type:complete
MKSLLLAATITLGLMLPAFAQDHGAMTGMSGAEMPASHAYAAMAEKMHADMAMTYTGDADLDFINAMIPHHQGAVEMARIVLEHGNDPEVRALAEAVIAAQEQEIAWMQDWLAKRDQ